MVNDTTPAEAAMHPAYRLLTDMSLNLTGPIPNPQEMPAILSTQDGDPVFLAGQLNWLSSLPGHGKSWVVLLAARQVLERGGFVVVFDYDNAGVVQWITRLRLLGIPDSDRLKIIQSPHLQPSDHRQIADLLKGYEPNLVVIDTATMAGAPTDGESVARWHNLNLRAYIEAEVGMLITDHLPKGYENRKNLGPIGTGSKLAAANVSLRLNGKSCWTPTEPGWVSLSADKDRYGLTGVPLGQPAYVIRGSYREGAFAATINHAKPITEDTLTTIETIIAEVLTEHGELGTNALVKAVRKRHKASTAAITGKAKTLALEGVITCRTKGQSKLYATVSTVSETVPKQETPNRFPVSHLGGETGNGRDIGTMKLEPTTPANGNT